MKANVKIDKITRASIRINQLQKQIVIDPKNLIKLSKTQKLDNIPSWSVVAWFHCPAKTMSNGDISPVCKGCYALTFEAGTNYSHTNTILARLYNAEAWKHDDFVPQMLRSIQNERYFRLFDSGDFYSIELAVKWLEIMKSAHWCHFWVPTRMYKDTKYHFILSEMQALPNVSVRFSSDSIDGDYSDIRGHNGSVVVQTVSENICPATHPDGDHKCGSCRNCWDKNIPVISYLAHGKAMKRQFQE